MEQEVFFIRQTMANKWAVSKKYADGKEELYRMFDEKEDAQEFCHYMNGGTPTEWRTPGHHRIYEYRIVRVY